MGLSVSSGPAAEPVSVSEAKLHLRVDQSTDDTPIGVMIVSARKYWEKILNRTFVNTTLVYTLDAFPVGTRDFIRPPRAPLGSVTSIAYVDINGSSQTWASSNYTVSTDLEPGRIGLAFNASWPTTQDVMDAVTITYVAGYGAAASNLDEDIISLVLLSVGDLYEHRSEQSEIRLEDNAAARALAWGLRVWEAV